MTIKNKNKTMFKIKKVFLNPANFEIKKIDATTKIKMAIKKE
jgi:hypothetical protein